MLRIPRTLCEEVIAHCHNQHPKEACGYLAADTAGMVVQVYPMTNVEDSPIGYAMDPKEQLTVEKRMRSRGQSRVGIYHSHTASAAYPSSVGVSLAVSPDISYVLVSLKDRERPELKSYRIDGARVSPEEVVIRDANTL